MFETPWHLFKWYSHMATSIPQPERKWEYKFYREMFTLLCAPEHLGKPQVFLLCEEKSQRKDISLMHLWTLTLWTLNPYYFIKCSTNNTRKKSSANKKGHFECVVERHRQILKNISWNHPERKVFQKEDHPKRTRNQHVSERVMTARVSPGLKTPFSFNTT